MMYSSAKLVALVALLSSPAFVAAVPFDANVPVAVKGESCDSNTTPLGCTADGSSVALCNQGQWVTQACPSGTSCSALSCTWNEAIPSNAASSGSSSAPSTAASNSVRDDPGYTVSSDPTSSASASGSASSSAESPAYSSSNPSSGGGSGGGSGDLSSITVAEIQKAVTDSGYPEPSSEVCQAFIDQWSKGDISSAQEAAMLIAELIWESGGFQYVSEIACSDGKSCAGSYATPGTDVSGKSYYGRGYIQLSWADNYKAASEDLFGDDRLLTDPDQVATDVKTAVAVSLWYWKARVHNAPGVSEGKFGAATKAINGGLECGTGSPTPAKRFAIYEKVLKAFNVQATPDSSGC